MTTSHYDLVVSGTHLPGLILAALCAKRGYRTLVTGSGCHDNTYLWGGHQFLRETEFLTGFESSPAAKEVMTGLSMALHMRSRPEKRQIAYQVLSREGRISVGAQEKSLIRDLSREYGQELTGLVQTGVLEEAQAVGQFLEEHPPLPAETWGEKREFTRLLETHPRIANSERILDPLRYLQENTPLRGFWESPLRFASRMEMGKAGALPRLRNFNHLRSGVYDVKGGVDALREGFIGKVRQYSCDYRPEIQFHAFQLKRGKVVEAMVQDRRESVGCNFIVCNQDEKTFFNLIAPEDRKERYHHRIHSLAPTHNVFTVNIALHPDGIPVGLSEHAFLVEDFGKPLEDENVIHIMKRGGAGGKEPVVLTASCHLKARHLLPSVSFIQEMTHKVLTRIRTRLLPFLDEHLLTVHCPWLELDPVSGEPKFAQQYVSSLYNSAQDALLQDSPLPLVTEYKNVLLCNRNSHSGLGLEGAFLSALNAYRIIEARMPLKSPLR